MSFMYYYIGVMDEKGFFKQDKKDIRNRGYSQEFYKEPIPRK